MYPSVSEVLPTDSYVQECGSVSRLPAIPQTAASRQRSPSPFCQPQDSHQHPTEFSMTQPFQDPRGRLYSSYNRRIRNFRPEGNPSRLKVGRAGGSWRHVSFTNGHQGNNILFIEGTVKQDDATDYPPYGWRQQPNANFMHYVSQRVVPDTMRGKTHSNPNYVTKYNENARKGFKYWYEEKKPRNNDWLWETPEITAKVN